MGSFRLYAAALVVFSVFGYFGTSYAEDRTTLDEMKQQLESMQKMIMQQQDQIRTLSSKLDNQSTVEGGHAVHEPVSHHSANQNHTELDHVVDERIKEFFESEESKELVAHNMPVEIGYDEGFFFKTHDEKFSMKINSMLQFKYNYGDANREEDNSSFSLRRARLTFNGNAYGEHMQYYGDLELRSTGSKDGSKSVELLDLFGTYEKYEFAKNRFGQWKVPFNGQFMTSEAELQMIDRSEADEVFNFGRQIGVMVFGALWEEKLEYFLGFWNGNFRNEKENDNNEHLWIARVMYDPLGHFGEAESDYEYHNKPLIHFEAAVAFDGENDITLELDGIGEFETDEIDKTQIVGEFGLKYKGFFFITEYYWRKRHIGTFRGLDLDDKNIIDKGFFCSGGIFSYSKKTGNSRKVFHGLV